MLIYILLAFLNGIVISTARTINGRLSTETGPLRASLWNHLVGFVFLTLVLLMTRDWKFEAFQQTPFAAYLGGIFGTSFVVVSSYVFPRIGAMNAALLVISGQMISAILLDWSNQTIPPTPLQCLGAITVLLGVILARVKNSTEQKRDSNA